MIRPRSLGAIVGRAMARARGDRPGERPGRGARWMDDARGGRQSERVIVDGAREMRGRVDRE